MCLFEPWFIHGLLVLLFYDMKKFAKVFRDRRRLRLYITIAYGPFPDILT